MTFEERVEAVSRFGFTERQAGFLVTVMLHSGVCLGRQYCAFAGLVRRTDADLFIRARGRRYATGQPAPTAAHDCFTFITSRSTTPSASPTTAFVGPTLARAVERLMVLDAVMTDRSLTWLGTERDKVSTSRAPACGSTICRRSVRSAD